MKKIIFLGVLLSSISAFAINIAVVDVADVVSKTDRAQVAKKAISKKREEANAEIKKLEDALNKKKDDIDSKASFLSKDKLQAESQELANQYREFQEKAQKLQADLEKEYTKYRNEIVDKIDQVVKDLSKKNDYDVVLLKNMVVYNKDSIDISKKVLDEVNKRLK